MKLNGVAKISPTAFSRRFPDRRRRRHAPRASSGMSEFERKLVQTCLKNGMKPEEIEAWMREI